MKARIAQQKRPPKSKGLAESNRENKLYVGNLDHRITEYHVIKMFSPFGKICCEEFMWHRHGPRRGEPRGFAFIEFSNKEEAEKAKGSMNGRLVLGRPLDVHFVDENVAIHCVKTSQQNTEVNCPSISSTSSCTVSKSSKIAAIQNKLKSMEQEESGVNKSGQRKQARLTSPISLMYSVEPSKVTISDTKRIVKNVSHGPIRCD